MANQYGPMENDPVCFSRARSVIILLEQRTLCVCVCVCVCVCGPCSAVSAHLFITHPILRRVEERGGREDGGGEGRTKEKCRPSDGDLWNILSVEHRVGGGEETDGLCVWGGGVCMIFVTFSKKRINLKIRLFPKTQRNPCCDSHHQHVSASQPWLHIYIVLSFVSERGLSLYVVKSIKLVS